MKSYHFFYIIGGNNTLSAANFARKIIHVKLMSLLEDFLVINLRGYLESPS